MGGCSPPEDCNASGSSKYESHIFHRILAKLYLFCCIPVPVPDIEDHRHRQGRERRCRGGRRRPTTWRQSCGPSPDDDGGDDGDGGDGDDGEEERDDECLTSVLPKGWTRTERLPLLYIMKVIMLGRNSLGVQT